MRLEIQRLANGICLVYQRQAHLAMLAGGKTPRIFRDVPSHALVDVREARQMSQADDAIAAFVDRYPSNRIDKAASQDLAKADFGRGAKDIFRSRLDAAPLSLSDLRADPTLEAPFCERDAECSGEHLWLTVQVEGIRCIWHIDRVRVRVVPPNPLLVMPAGVHPR